MGPIMEGAGLNVTVLSYMDNVDFGFLAAAELVPDVDDMADFVSDVMDDLLAAADEIDPPTPVPPHTTAPATGDPSRNGDRAPDAPGDAPAARAAPPATTGTSAGKASTGKTSTRTKGGTGAKAAKATGKKAKPKKVAKAEDAAEPDVS
jgi:hypothetical protein